MQASARTCGSESAVLRQHDPKCKLRSSQAKSIYCSHSSQSTSTNYYIILGPRDKAAPPTSQQIGQFPPKPVKYRHRHAFFFFFLPHPQESSLCSQPVRGKIRRTRQIFPHVERRFLDHEYSCFVVRLGSRSKSSPN